MLDNEEGIRIGHGPTGGDCTSLYYITLEREMTVKEFIEKQLKDDREWGSFEIRYSSPVLRANTHCIGYNHGKLSSYTLDTIPCGNAKIKKCSGSGGWSRSDFIITI